MSISCTKKFLNNKDLEGKKNDNKNIKLKSKKNMKKKTMVWWLSKNFVSWFKKLKILRMAPPKSNSNRNKLTKIKSKVLSRVKNFMKRK